MWEAVRRWPQRHPEILVALLALAAFAPALGGGFLYDDHHVILNNPNIQDLGRLDAVLLHNPARPLLGLSWALNFAVGGLRPWPYHLVNLLLHAGSAVLVLWLFRWIAKRSSAMPQAVPVVAACLFAITPMAAETAAYVSSRSTSLCALFVLLSLRVTLPALEARSTRRLLAGLALFVLAMASKEEAYSLPLYLLLLDLFFLARGRVAALRPRLRWHAAFFALPALGLVARRMAMGDWLPEPAIDRGIYALTQLAAFPGYLARALVPVAPALFRGVTPAPWPPDASTILLASVGVALLGAAWLKRDAFPLESFVVLWLAAGLMPSSSLLPLAEMVVDHRAYLGGAAACLLLAHWLWRPGIEPFAVAVLLLLGARSLHYSWVLAEPVRAWQDAVRRVPDSADAHIALADVYARSGWPVALDAYRDALRLDPDNGEAWSNLGAYLVQTGQLPQAERAFRQAARVRPDDARVRDNLGLVLSQLRRHAEARVEFEAAIASQPPLAQPRLNLAALLVQDGDMARARHLLDEARLLYMDDDDRELMRQIERVLEMEPPGVP